MLQVMIDIGSNTIRMAIYRILGGQATLLTKRKQTVGLAGYVEDGVMSREGIDAAIRVLREYASFLNGLGIAHKVTYTTAALRNAKNSAEAIAAIEEATGLSIRVLSGEEEAELDFVGATHALPAPSGLIVDIGGGSTEIVHYDDHRICDRISLPIGAMKLKKAFVAGVLPTHTEVNAMFNGVNRFLLKEFADHPISRLTACGKPLSGDDYVTRRAACVAHSKQPFMSHIVSLLAHMRAAPSAVLCGIGGTCKAALSMYRATEDPEAETLSRLDIVGLIQHFSVVHTLHEENLATLLATEPDRVHTLLPGLVILESIMSWYRIDAMCYSDAGVREGYLYKEILPNL